MFSARLLSNDYVTDIVLGLKLTQKTHSFVRDTCQSNKYMYLLLSRKEEALTAEVVAVRQGKGPMEDSS